MNDIVKFDSYERDAEGLLREAAEQGFETVVIIGFIGDEVHLKSSSRKSTIQMLGTLRAAEDFILRNW